MLQRHGAILQPQQLLHARLVLFPIQRAKHAASIGHKQRRADRRRQPVEMKDSGGFARIRLFQCGCARCPQMQRRVGAPRPPAFGTRKQFGRRRSAAIRRGQRPQQPDVGGRERVRLAQFAHRDVLRGPFADTGQRPQFCDGIVEAGVAAKIAGSAAIDLRQCAGRPRARAGHAERGQIGARRSARRRETDA